MVRKFWTLAFNRSFVNTFTAAINLIRSRSTTNIIIGSVGYPDLIIRNDQINLVPCSDLAQSVIKNEKALRWHNLDPSFYSALSIEAFCETSGITFEYLDIMPGTGTQNCFQHIDLNLPIPEHLYCKYDLLIDSGTAEHCFNIGKVFENYFHMLKPGGILIQYIPFLSPNHGFWSINPTTIYDMARVNPIKLFQMNLNAYKSYLHYFDCIPIKVEFQKVKRFNLPVALGESVILAEFCYKKISKSIFKFPVQSKYLQ